MDTNDLLQSQVVKKIYRSSIEPFDIFLAKGNGQYNKSGRHYFVCIYSQEKDINNHLSNDLYGLMITSNNKYAKFFDNNFNDYNVEIKFNGKISYALCDKILRIPNNKNVIKTEHKLTNGEIYNIKKYLKKFMDEIKRQTNIKE